MKELEEEAEEKAQEEGCEEEGKKGWEEVGIEAMVLVKILLKKRGERTVTMGQLQKEKEEERKAKEEALKEKAEALKREEEAVKEKEEWLKKEEALKQENETIRRENEQLKAKLGDADGSKREGEKEGRDVKKITSLDGIRVFFPHRGGIKREGNCIINSGIDLDRNCFIGEKMRTV